MISIVPKTIGEVGGEVARRANFSCDPEAELPRYTGSRAGPINGGAACPLHGLPLLDLERLFALGIYLFTKQEWDE